MYENSIIVKYCYEYINIKDEINDKKNKLINSLCMWISIS